MPWIQFSEFSIIIGPGSYSLAPPFQQIWARFLLFLCFLPPMSSYQHSNSYGNSKARWQGKARWSHSVLHWLANASTNLLTSHKSLTQFIIQQGRVPHYKDPHQQCKFIGKTQKPWNVLKCFIICFNFFYLDGTPFQWDPLFWQKSFMAASNSSFPMNFPLENFMKEKHVSSKVLILFSYILLYFIYIYMM
jgi:hypothetical protein